MASIPNAVSEEFYENLPTTLYHLQVVKYITVASLVFNLWDLAISFLDEVHLVWVAPLSWVKCLFLLNRYLGPLILTVNVSVLLNKNVTDAMCRNWFRLEGWGGLVVVAVVQVILVLRITALYERSIVVSRILVLGFVGQVATCMTILGLGLERIQPIRHLGSIPVGCITDKLPRFFFSLFIPHLIMESILFSLTVIQSVRTLPKGSWYSTPLLMLVLRDGTMYFFAMFAVTCTTTFAWLFASTSLMKISIAPLIAISSVSGCRIILNLRALHKANDKVRVPEISLATFDLGDLEMRTLTLQRTTKTTTAAFGDPAEVPRTPQLPPPLPGLPRVPSKVPNLADTTVDVELDLENFKSRRTTIGTDEDDFDYDYDDDWDYGYRFTPYPDHGAGRRSGKWGIPSDSFTSSSSERRAGDRPNTVDSPHRTGRIGRSLASAGDLSPRPTSDPSPLQPVAPPVRLSVLRRSLVARLPPGLTRGTEAERRSG